MDNLITQGLAVLLTDPDAKHLVLEYLQNIADAAKPQKQRDNWVTVWEAISEETREIDGKSWRLHLETWFDDRARVVVTIAHVRAAGFTFKMPAWELREFREEEYQFTRWNGWYYHATFAADHYTDAILIGQRSMETAMAAWDKHLGGNNG